MATIQVSRYQSADGRIPFTEWIATLRDRRANQAIAARILRMQAGNRGDWKALGAGVFELRIDTGPGYRLYCGQDGATLVLLLCAGDKRTQAKDIERAHDYWKDYQARR
ncbi:MAG: type II toxin-antitoxin system RelE/ParE family toxin [Rhodanobacteraceae bacterium]